MAVTVKLKNHQNYVLNKKRERNVNYPGGLYNTTVTGRSLRVFVLGRVGNFWSCIPVRVGKTKNENEIWSLKVSVSIGTLVCTMNLYRILGVGDRATSQRFRNFCNLS